MPGANKTRGGGGGMNYVMKSLTFCLLPDHVGSVAKLTLEAFAGNGKHKCR